jgi:Protein of unknown function (DUF664)
MTGSDLLVDGFGRIREMAEAVLDGISPEHLTARLDPEANTIAWLVWHLTRVQDDHVAGVAGMEQLWMAEGWAGRFDLPLDLRDIGYGHSPEQVGVVKAGPTLLAGYLDAVHGRTLPFLSSCGDEAWDRVVDENWDPPVTLGVRMVSVLTDNLAHAGQAAYVRGVLERR